MLGEKRSAWSGITWEAGLLEALFLTLKARFMDSSQDCWLRVSRGALAGVQGRVFRDLDNHRLLIAVATPTDQGEYVVVPGVYLEIEAACVEPVD